MCKVLETFRERGGHWKDIAEKYYNPVIENFTCAENIYTAVEVTAGARLFHHIVESDRVGTEILKEMNKQKLPGEVTFMPLNRLIVRDQNYPKTEVGIPRPTFSGIMFHWMKIVPDLIDGMGTVK